MGFVLDTSKLENEVAGRSEQLAAVADSRPLEASPVSITAVPGRGPSDGSKLICTVIVIEQNKVKSVHK